MPSATKVEAPPGDFNIMEESSFLKRSNTIGSQDIQLDQTSNTTFPRAAQLIDDTQQLDNETEFVIKHM